MRILNKIIIHKQSGANIRQNGVLIRISPETKQQLDELSEETGISTTRLADFLLKKALKLVEVVESEV